MQSQIRKVSPNVTIREQDLLKNLQKAKKQFAHQHSHSTSREHRERSKSQTSLVKIHSSVTANRDLNQTQPISTKKDEYRSYRKFTEQPSPKKATALLKTTKSALKTYEKPQSATAKHAISRSNSAQRSVKRENKSNKDINSEVKRTRATAAQEIFKPFEGNEFDSRRFSRIMGQGGKDLSINQSKASMSCDRKSEERKRSANNR